MVISFMQANLRVQDPGKAKPILWLVLPARSYALGPSLSPRYTADLIAIQFGSKAGIELNLLRRSNPDIR